MSNLIITALIAAVAVITHYGNASRILCVFPTASISHQVVYRGLTLALNKRGHEVVVVTPDPVNDPTLKNYTEIDMSFLYNPEWHFGSILGKRNVLEWFQLMETFEFLTYITRDMILSHPELRRLYAPDSNEKFDLLIMETIFSPSILPLATRFDAPVISILSLGLLIHDEYANGNPVLTSNPSTWELGKKVIGSLTLWQRIENFIDVWKYIYHYNNYFMSKHEAIARKHFGNDIPSLRDLRKNISLFFVNQHPPISYAKSQPPNVIDISGFHISKKILPLNEDLQKILDEAVDGFVYMSLGTNAKSNTLPPEILQKFIAAFSKLPYKVIWKFEDDVLPGKPDNVYTIKWAPQQSILAHPNLKVFVYQGGLQSTEEAVQNAIPLISFPVLADQDMQANIMATLGVAKTFEISNFNSDDLFEAIRSIALDNSYKQKMINLRSLFNDKPHDPLENAIWWTEYVIRHRGAPHLRPVTADEPWYRFQDMDVIAIISAGSVILVILTLAILYRCLVHSINHSFVDESARKKIKQK